MMVKRTMFFLLVTLVVIVSLSSGVMAEAPLAGDGQDYIVQADDWLSKLADKFYGDPLAYLIIVEATNQRAVQDVSYTMITDPDVIEIGQKIFVPIAAELPGAVVEAARKEEAVSEDIVAIRDEPTEEQLRLLASLNVKGTPPELYNETWLNSEPLKLADLHGKVVIVQFWTFGCINCKNVIPSLREWHHNYKDDGLVIIGVHTPEFSYEADVDNVREALVRLDVPYAVAIDSDWRAWRDYKKPFNQRYWPSKYFIDKAGSVRHIHIGEGGYSQQEDIIKALLAEKI